MKTFSLNVLDASGATAFADVASFVGEDASGSFGILAGHALFVTALVIGLGRFRAADGLWRYIAMPGAVLHFKDDVLTLSTRRCLIDDDYTRISTALAEQLLTEEEKLQSMKQSLRRMEDEVLKRLWEMGRSEAWAR
jgi:F-type H+-transporting ATPase subunit epsilon